VERCAESGKEDTDAHGTRRFLTVAFRAVRLSFGETKRRPVRSHGYEDRTRRVGRCGAAGAGRVSAGEFAGGGWSGYLDGDESGFGGLE
jgi:hypothetical protein